MVEDSGGGAEEMVCDVDGAPLDGSVLDGEPDESVLGPDGYFEEPLEGIELEDIWQELLADGEVPRAVPRPTSNAGSRLTEQYKPPAGPLPSIPVKVAPPPPPLSAAVPPRRLPWQSVSPSPAGSAAGSHTARSQCHPALLMARSPAVDSAAAPSTGASSTGGEPAVAAGGVGVGGAGIVAPLPPEDPRVQLQGCDKSGVVKKLEKPEVYYTKLLNAENKLESLQDVWYVRELLRAYVDATIKYSWTVMGPQ